MRVRHSLSLVAIVFKILLLLRPLILFSHPSGNNNVREAAMALRGDGALTELHLGIAACGGNIFDRLGNLPGMSEIRRRTYDSSLRNILRLHPSREAVRLVANRLGWRSLIAHESGIFCVDAVYAAFDHAVARRVATICNSSVGTRLKLAGVYCYEDGALETFKVAKANGLHRFYDLPIAYWRTARTLLEEEARRWPDWEPTLVGTRDSAAKCARKDEELELANTIICASNFVRDSMPPELLRGKSVSVIPFGSPESLLKNTSGMENGRSVLENGKKDVSSSAPLRVLFAGSMTQRKGLADLFAAMKLLDPERVELHVMGSPIASMQFYRQQYSSFIHHATRSHDQVLQLMRTMDVFCLPSIVEGRALVMQEAMSQGLPVIITPNTGGEDLVDVANPIGGNDYGRGATGFLVPIRSPGRIVESIQWCCEHREEVFEMGNAAISKAREYTWQAYREGIVQTVRASIGRSEK